MINVTLGETFRLTLEAEDPDGDVITFDVPTMPPGASFTTSGNQLIFVWNVDSPEPVCVPVSDKFEFFHFISIFPSLLF